MTLIEIARIYTDLVKAENEIPDSEFRAKEEINALRTKYHQVFMDKLTEEGIEFADRFDAMNQAFEIVKKADSDDWDTQIGQNIRDGKLKHLAKEAKASLKAGTSHKM